MIEEVALHNECSLFDILIKIKHHQDGFLHTKLNRVLKIVNDALVDWENKKLLDILDRQTDSIDLFRALYSKNRPSNLLITSISNGSVIVEAAFCAGATWLLINTLGETLKESWKNTSLHKKLISFLSTPIYREDLQYIQSRIEKTIQNYMLNKYRDEIKSQGFQSMFSSELSKNDGCAIRISKDNGSTSLIIEFDLEKLYLPDKESDERLSQLQDNISENAKKEIFFFKQRKTNPHVTKEEREQAEKLLRAMFGESPKGPEDEKS